MTRPVDGEVRYLYGFLSHHPRLRKLKCVYYENRTYAQVTGNEIGSTGIKGAPFIDQWGIYEQVGGKWCLSGRNTTEGLERSTTTDRNALWWTSRKEAVKHLVEWCSEAVHAKARQLAEAKWNLSVALAIPDEEEEEE